MPPRDVLEQRSEIRGHAAHRETAAVGASEHQEILGEPDEMVGLFGRAPQRGAQLIWAPFPGEGQIELGLQDRERGPQLVARVVDEPTLGLDRRLDPVQEVVHRRPEPGDLVIGRREGQTAAEIGRRDVGRLAAACARPAPRRHPPATMPASDSRSTAIGIPIPSVTASCSSWSARSWSEVPTITTALPVGVCTGTANSRLTLSIPGSSRSKNAGAEIDRITDDRKHRCPSHDVVRADDLAVGVGDLCERLIGLDEPGTDVTDAGPLFRASTTRIAARDRRPASTVSSRSAAVRR